MNNNTTEVIKDRFKEKEQDKVGTHETYQDKKFDKKLIQQLLGSDSEEDSQSTGNPYAEVQSKL